MSTLLSDARVFAIRAHAGQVRKYTAEPYIHHCEAVACMVAAASGDEAMVAAAWLHDTVEDTPTTVDELRARFGEDVAELVSWLTDVSRPEDGNRAARKALDRAHIAQAPARAKAIKLADLIDNTSSIVDRDPGFAKVYMAEKRALLAVLADVTDGWPSSTPLLARAQGLVDEYFRAHSGEHHADR